MEWRGPTADYMWVDEVARYSKADAVFTEKLIRSMMEPVMSAEWDSFVNG